MKKYFNTTALKVATLTALGSAFSISANAGDVDYPWGDKYLKDPYAKVSPEHQKYHDYQNNEFYIILTSPQYPEGKRVKIDPDDLFLFNSPRYNGRVSAAPRERFWLAINAQLPNVPGLDMPAPKEGEAIGVKFAATFMKHLSDAYPQGHGLPREQLIEAVKKCLPALDIVNE